MDHLFIKMFLFQETSPGLKYSYCVLAIIELFGYNFPFEKLSLTNLQPLDFFICRTLHVSWTASYEINLIRLSVRLSVRLSARLSVCLSICQSARLSINKFFQDWIISFFSDIVHDDSWPWYLVTDEAIFLNKTFWWLKFWSNRPKLGQKWDFCYFLKFGSLVFLEIA